MWLVREEAWCESVGRISDEDLARLGGLLKTSGDVDRIPENSEFALLVADRTRHREPSVHANAQRQVSPRPLRDPGVLTVERAEDGERCPLSAFGMILLVADRAEDGDHGIADVLLDEPTRRADLRSDRVPRCAHVLVQLFGIEPFGQRGET